MDKYNWCVLCGSKIGKKSAKKKAKNNAKCSFCQRINSKRFLEHTCINYSSYSHDYISSCPLKCIGCLKEYTGTFKIHIKGPYCAVCHVKEINTQREHVSYYVTSDRDIYDMMGRRLCDVVGCNIYSKHLNNAYNGFFCNNHYKYMEYVRDTIKMYPDTEIEYFYRIQEINLRKTICESHVSYAKNLHAHLFYKDFYPGAGNHATFTQNMGIQESEYINLLFS